MPSPLPDLGKAYRASSYEDKAEFSREVKERLFNGVYDAIDALCHEAKNSKNSQARVAAARQVVRLAFVTGVLERDSLKEFLSELGAEFDKELGKLGL
jgi:hypothetical protein